MPHGPIASNWIFFVPEPRVGAPAVCPCNTARKETA
jgi:hypothetical protein